MEPKAPHAKCDDCPLQKNKLVLGRGPEGVVHLAIVGESPGRVEARVGKPFVGPSGELLQRTIDAHGVGEVWVTNAALCYPPKGAAKEFAAQCCRDRLFAELRSKAPKVILALGNIAVNAILGDIGAGITSRRGIATPCPELGCVVIPTFHPAAILRRPEMFRDFATDVEKAVRPRKRFKVTGTDATPAKARVLNLQDSVDFLSQAPWDGRPAALDLETSGFDRLRDRILCVVIATSKGVFIVPRNVVYESNLRGPLRIALCNRDVRWVGHGSKFDQSFLQGQFGFMPQFMFDTMLAHYALDERIGTHDLKVICGQAFDVPNWENDIKRYLAHPRKDSYALLPPDVLHRYAAFDGVYTRRLAVHLSQHLKNESGLQRLLARLLMPGSNALAAVESYGTLIDPEAVEAARDDFGTRLWDLSDKLEELSGNPELNPNSPKQLAVILFDKLHLPMYSGRSTRAAVLERLKGMHPFVDVLAEYRKVHKLSSTYVEGLLKVLGPDGRAHTSFLLHGTVTGRLSSRGPNLQNIPREPLTIRNFFIPSPGCSFVYADYSQMEFRMLAMLSEDPFLVQAYREGRDLHSEVAAEMFGPDFTLEQRVWAKMVNFGLTYGRSAPALAKDTRIPGRSQREAQQYIERFFGRMPQATAYIKSIREQAKSQGHLETLTGRKRRFGLLTPQNINEVLRQAVNFPMQSLASDTTLTALIRLHKLFSHEGAVRVLLTVHDSILVECPQGIVPEVVHTMRRVMQDTATDMYGDIIPYKVDVETGDRWGTLSPWR